MADLREKIEKVIGDSEIISDAGNYFDAESVQQYADELVEAVVKLVENEWIPLPAKEPLPAGWYVFKVKHPITGEGIMAVHKMDNGLSVFEGATHCKLIV